MGEIILSLLADIFGGKISDLLKKREPSEHKKCYENIRRDVAEALAMYACCFHNPIDLADTPDHKLPPLWEDGSHKIRELASRLKALAEIMPNKKKTDVPISIEKMNDAAGCLYGISNSFHTPYGMGWTAEDRKVVEKYEDELREILVLNHDR